MPALEPDNPGTLRLHVKAVPGASRDELAGPLGDRLKIRIAAPPEDGRANRSIILLLSGVLGLRPAQIELLGGRSSPEKTFRLNGIEMDEAATKLGLT